MLYPIVRPPLPRPESHQRRRPHHQRSLHRMRLPLPFVLLVLGLLWTQTTILAQLPEPLPVPSVAAPLMKTYGVADTEFVFGAYTTKFAKPQIHFVSDDGADSVWNYMHSLGCNVMYLTVGQGSPGIGWANAFSGEAKPGDRVMIVDYIGGAGGFGRDVELYPWDSVQIDSYRNKFLGRYGGQINWNQAEREHRSTDIVDTVRHPMREQYYSSSGGDTANERILWNVVYGYQPQQIKRYPSVHSTTWTAEVDSIQNSSKMTGQRDVTTRALNGAQMLTYYVAVTGHLSDSTKASVAGNASVLRVEIWNEIPKGTGYRDSSGAWTVDNTNDHEFLYTTIYVPKDSLKRDSSRSFENYRTPAFPFNIDHCPTCMDGPLRTESHRFDIRVYWTGKENLSLRSVSIRDSLGQLIDGYLPGSADFRQTTLDTARCWVRGGQATYPPDSLHANIIGLGAGNEAPELEYKAFATINQMIRDSFNLAMKYHRAGAPGDSLTVWQYDQAQLALHQTGNLPYTHIYSYLNDPRDTLTGPDLAVRYDIPFAQLPTIRQHNGGRFHLPLLLDLDSLGIPKQDTTLKRRVEDYESILQQSFFGKFYPNGLGGPLNQAIIPALGKAGTIFRATGSRVIQVPGIIASLEARMIAGQLDTLGGRYPEPSELLAVVNLGLCYGSRGISWWSFADSHEPYTDSTTGADHIPWYRGGNSCCIGGNGMNVTDSVANYVHLVHDWDGGSAIIRNYYIGWNDRINTVRAITKNWLQKVGPIMAKLRWRNSYSVYAAVPWISPRTGTTSTADLNVRTIPSSEIVTAVTAHPVHDTTLDPAYRTFVEIGLFDAKRDSKTVHDPINDTNFVMVVNRRAFAPIKNPHQDSVTNILDTLAEHRTITLKLHLPIVDPTGDNFVRVTDIFPSGSDWMGDNGGWARIDTVVNHDSSVTLTLAPGRAALLRITSAAPVLAGDLRFNGQRKLLFDGRRYHSVYHRYNGNEYGSFWDTVFYRRSLPLNDSTAPIRWEAAEHAVSLASGLGDYTRSQNRFPSMTLRTRPNDTTITIVWTCHADSAHEANHQREIVTRDFRYGRHYVGKTLVAYEQWSPIAHIDWHAGLDHVVWGTPVISRLDAAEVIAWSDSTLGIVARARLPLDSIAIKTFIPVTESARLLVSFGLTMAYGTPGSRPSVPPFAHIASHDSTCAVVFQQPAGPPNTDIYYLRVKQDSVIGSGVRLVAVAAPLVVGGPGVLGNPCVDQTQDALNRIQDGVTWESMEPYFSNGLCVNFASVITTGTSSTLASWPAQALAQTSPGIWVRPSTASLNRVFTIADTAQDPLFAVAFHSIDQYYPMGQALISYKATSFKTGWPQPYSLGGWYPNTGAAPVKQSTRQAAFYSLTDNALSSPANGTLTTTRQFFLKTRPTGYMADGRSVRLRISDSLETGFVAGMHDIWIATEHGGHAVAMIARPTGSERTDSIGDVAPLMRTEYFTVSDSVTLGGTFFGKLYGDPGRAGSSRITCVADLVDSASGNVIARLDSFEVSADADSVVNHPAPDLDLLRGTYYVRFGITSPAMPSDTDQAAPRYPVTELASYVQDDSRLGKLTRIDRGGTSTARISAQPNPMTAGTELRFSIVADDYVTVRVVDALGREVLRPVDHVRTEAGRYAIAVDGSGLERGAYLVEIDAGREHAVTKLFVVR